MIRKDILILKGDRPNTEKTGSFLTWKNLTSIGKDNYFLEQYSDMIFTIINGEVSITSAVTGRDVASYDLVYIRDLGHEEVRNTIALYLEKRNKAFINSELKQRQYPSKLIQYVAYADAGLAVPDTAYANVKHRERALGLLGARFPLVIKSTTGSNGNDNFLVSSLEELNSLDMTAACVIQPFLENKFDYRIVVAENDILIDYSRFRSGDGYRNNISQVGRLELINDLPRELADMAVQAARAVNRDLAGVDILVAEKTGRPYILEVNFNYGTPEFDTKTDTDYFEKLANFLRKRAS